MRSCTITIKRRRRSEWGGGGGGIDGGKSLCSGLRPSNETAEHGPALWHMCGNVWPKSRLYIYLNAFLFPFFACFFPPLPGVSLPSRRTTTLSYAPRLMCPLQIWAMLCAGCLPIMSGTSHQRVRRTRPILVLTWIWQ